MTAKTCPSEAAGQPGGIDEQLWPIVCATMVLVGIVGVIVAANSDFEEERVFLNGYTHLAGLAAAAALLILIASRLKGAARRTAELAILLSLALHTAAGVGAFYLFTSPLGPGPLDAARDAWPESDDESLPPDYHWAQDDDQPEQAFEKSLVTTIRDPQSGDPAPPAAQMQSADMERPAPVAEVRHVLNDEITPLVTSGVPEPGGLPEIRRSDAATIEEAKLPEAPAMVRQESDDVPLPKSDSPVPAALPQARKGRSNRLSRPQSKRKRATRLARPSRRTHGTAGRRASAAGRSRAGRIAARAARQRSASAVGASPAGGRLASASRRFRPQCQPGRQPAADPVRDGMESSRGRENCRKSFLFWSRRRRIQSRPAGRRLDAGPGTTLRRSAESGTLRDDAQCQSGQSAARQRRARPRQHGGNRGPGIQRAAPHRARGSRW